MTMIKDQPPGRASGTEKMDLAESVAGEEDPGASIEVGASQPSRDDPPAGANTPMSPGDQAPAGTPGTGEDVCPDCGGSGRQGDRPCPTCEGTGKITVAIGGA